MDLYQLVYVSQATHDFSHIELLELLEEARKNNTHEDITGNLLYNGGLFLQVLEGDKSKIEALYKKIALDSRHQKVKKVYLEPAKFRLFARWSMNMVNLDTDKPKNLEKLKQIVHAAKSGEKFEGAPAPVALLREFTNI